MKDFREQFREAFDVRLEDLPELTLGTLDARNRLEFNKRRNYSLEHNENQNFQRVQEILKVEK